MPSAIEDVVSHPTAIDTVATTAPSGRRPAGGGLQQRILRLGASTTSRVTVHRSLGSQGVGRGCGVGLGLGMGVPLGVGLGRTVAVGVAVAVGVGVTEGVTVAEGVAVGVGVGPEGVILKGPLVEELFWKRPSLATTRTRTSAIPDDGGSCQS
jgi:hypothetical protein